ncbi:hypothetical protein D3C71_1491990 [compost metagenome]
MPLHYIERPIKCNERQILHVNRRTVLPTKIPTNSHFQLFTDMPKSWLAVSALQPSGRPSIHVVIGTGEDLEQICATPDITSGREEVIVGVVISQPTQLRPDRIDRIIQVPRKKLIAHVQEMHEVQRHSESNRITEHSLVILLKGAGNKRQRHPFEPPINHRHDLLPTHHQ